MNIIYLHGFNSDGEGWKSAALRRHFPKAQVQAPDLPADPQAVKKIVENCINHCATPPLLVGSSLGGFYAYYHSSLHHLRAMLFNPSLSPHLTLDDRGIGVFKTWTQGRPYHFKREYLPVLEQMKADASRQQDQKLLYFFLATDDEVLNHQSLPAQFPEAHVQWFPQAGHGFSKFEKVLKLMKKEF
ncbi:YqiA/YcfP family alpha/beta fold hydrolase [Lewinella sp. LCG006]|uniref:YqiA/YcfP family alpha/beta fold hydrolase n=1 Tax=Lewinella sp. LCG006 TaxID=3231911 RepID=UPI003460A57C